MSCCCEGYWKRGPSIDNLTRKKIWEENFKIRENLKGIQQSEHFWSFQMTRQRCCGSSPPKNQPRRCVSLQNLDRVDCSSHCDPHNRPEAVLPTVCHLHQRSSESPSRFRRDVGTETSPMRFDKSVGPEQKMRQVRLSTYQDESPFQHCSRYKPPEWGRNDSKQYRQQSLQKLRKNEEALRQSIQRSKKGLANPGGWGTEYSRSYKDSSWPRPLGTVPRSTFQSRAGTPMPRSILGGRATPLVGNMYGTDTPMSRYAVG